MNLKLIEIVIILGSPGMEMKRSFSIRKQYQSKESINLYDEGDIKIICHYIKTKQRRTFVKKPVFYLFGFIYIPKNILYRTTNYNFHFLPYPVISCSELNLCKPATQPLTKAYIYAS